MEYNYLANLVTKTKKKFFRTEVKRKREKSCYVEKGIAEEL